MQATFFLSHTLIYLIFQSHRSISVTPKRHDTKSLQLEPCSKTQTLKGFDLCVNCYITTVILSLLSEVPAVYNSTNDKIHSSITSTFGPEYLGCYTNSRECGECQSGGNKRTAKLHRVGHSTPLLIVAYKILWVVHLPQKQTVCIQLFSPHQGLTDSFHISTLELDQPQKHTKIAFNRTKQVRWRST